MQEQLRIVPANEASPGDLDAVFGSRGVGATRRCQGLVQVFTVPWLGRDEDPARDSV